MRGLAPARAADRAHAHACSLADFEAYLANHEVSLENLHFIVWFQDYAARFFRLAPEVRALAPGPSDTEFRRLSAGKRTVPTEGDTRRLAEQADEALRAVVGLSEQELIEEEAAHRMALRRLSIFDVPAMNDEAQLPGDDDSRSAPRKRSTSSASVVESEETLNAAAAAGGQPFREECMHIVETFLRPGGQKELTLDERVRDTALRSVALSTHPIVVRAFCGPASILLSATQFLPVYDHVYHTLEAGALARFLEYSATNINLSRQAFAYASVSRRRGGSSYTQVVHVKHPGSRRYLRSNRCHTRRPGSRLAINHSAILLSCRGARTLQLPRVRAPTYRRTRA